MRLIEHHTFDMERALYGEEQLYLKNCTFDGPMDGESALKECHDVKIQSCFFNLRYPFWHNHNLKIRDTELTSFCRAALWYSDHMEIVGCKLHGIKALRECHDVVLANCDILSAEFGWSVQNLEMHHCTVASEYFMLRAESLHFSEVQLKGKYAFQYTQNVIIENSILDTKDAFWHSQNVTIKNSVLKGEYLAWYSEGLTLINCKIIGTQPFCYCKKLTLDHCEMYNTDLCFEKSEVNATIITPVVSIKNPLSGTIYVPSIGEVILNDTYAKGNIVVSCGQKAEISA